MLNVQIIAIKPLTLGWELDIIQIVSIRSLAPGHDMREGTDHTFANRAKSFRIGEGAPGSLAAGNTGDHNLEGNTREYFYGKSPERRAQVVRDRR